MTKIEKIVLGFALVLGSCLRLYKLGEASFVNNELYLMLHFPILQQDFGEFLHSFFEWEIHPPLNHFIMYIWGLIVGFDEFSQRLLPSLLGIFSLFLIYKATRRAFGHQAGVVAAVLLSFNFASISLSRIATSYGWQMFFTTLAFYLMVEILEGRRAKRRQLSLSFGYFLCAVAMCYIHYFLAGMVFFQLIVALVLFPAHRKLFAAVAGAGFLCFLPWVPVILRQYPRLSSHDYPRGLGDTPLWDYLLYLANGSAVLGLLFLGSLLLAGSRFFRAQPVENTNQNRMEILFLISSVVPLFTIYLICLLATPMWNMHYLALLIPPQIILLSRVFQTSFGPRGLSVILIVFLSYTAFSYQKGHFEDDYVVRVELREAVKFVVDTQARASGDDQAMPPVLNHGWSQYLFHYYFKRNSFDDITYLVENGRLDVLSTKEGIEKLDQYLKSQGQPRMWLLNTYNPLSPLLRAYIQKNFRQVIHQNFHKASATLLERRAHR